MVIDGYSTWRTTRLLGTHLESVKRTSRVDSQKSVLAIHKHVTTDLITNLAVMSISPDLSCRSWIAGGGGSDSPF